MDALSGTKVADISSGSAAGRITETKGRTEDIPRGIVMMVIATVLFASASAASKWL